MFGWKESAGHWSLCKILSCNQSNDDVEWQTTWLSSQVSALFSSDLIGGFSAMSMAMWNSWFNYSSCRSKLNVWIGVGCARKYGTNHFLYWYSNAFRLPAYHICHIQIVSRLILESANLIGFPQMCLSRIRFSMFSQFKYTVFGVCAEDLKLFRGTKGAGLRIEKMCFRPFKQWIQKAKSGLEYIIYRFFSSLGIIIWFKVFTSTHLIIH